MFLSNFNPIAGFSNTVFPGGLVAQGLILAFKGAAGAVFNYGKYRYEWLKIFKDLGSLKILRIILLPKEVTTIFKQNRLLMMESLCTTQKKSYYRY